MKFRYWCSMCFTSDGTLLTYSDLENSHIMGIFLISKDYNFKKLLFLKNLHVNNPNNKIPVFHLSIKTINELEKFIEISEISFKTRLRYKMVYSNDRVEYIEREKFLEHLRPYIT